ncbi:MAG: two-component regulator propeller domain-containing protein [Ignavibacteriales bacterium]
MKFVKILFTIFVICSSVYSQTKQWVNSYAESQINSQFVEGQYLWISNITDIIKLNTLNGALEPFELKSNGIYYDYIFSITVDSLGHKWVGTSEGGMLKYDNQSWKVFNTSNSGLSGNVVYSIAIDHQGNKWIGTDNGLVKYNDTTWTVYNTSNSGIPENNILIVAIDKKGNKWLGTYNGLIKFDGISWNIYNASNSGIPGNEIHSIAIDKQGSKWIGTLGGLGKYNDTSWTVYNTTNSSIPSNGIGPIIIDKYGNKWIGTFWKGLVKYNDTTWVTYDTSNSGIPNNYVLSIAIDSMGNKWIGTCNDVYLPDGDLTKFDGKTWIRYKTSNSGLPNNMISKLAVDHQGNRWIASGKGLVKFNGLNWTVYNTGNSGIPGNDIGPIAVDQQDNLWFVVSDGDLVKYDGNTWTLYKNTLTDIPAHSVGALAIDHQGVKWIGTSDAGLIKYDGKTWTLYNKSNSGLTSDIILSIAVDKLDNKWLGTWTGTLSGDVIKYDNKNWTVFRRSAPVFAIAIDENGNKWVGSRYSELAKYNDTTWTVYTVPFGEVSIQSVSIDQQGNKWLLSNGLIKFDDNVWTKYSTSNSGILSNTDYTLAIDLSDNKWIGTFRGLSAFREGGVILTSRPDIPKLISVKNNSKDQPVNLSLTWENVISAETYHFQLAKDSLFMKIVVDDSMITSLSRSITGLPEGIIYYWRVRAKNIAGTSLWSEIWDFTTLLNAPDSLKAKLLSKSKLQLSWADLSAGEDGFIIERKLSENFLILDTVKANVTSYIDSTADQLVTYQYRIKSYTQFAVSAYSNIASIKITGVNDQKRIPTVYSLSQNYPNPFNPVTTIRYSLPKPSFVQLKITDLLGREVLALVGKDQSAGEYNVQLDASSLPSGIYIYTIVAGQFRDSKKLLLIK